VSRKRRSTSKVPPHLGLDERLALLRAEVARLEDTLADDESWRALRLFDTRSDRDSRDVATARARLEKALEAQPAYRARARIAEAIAILSSTPLDLDDAHSSVTPPVQEPVFMRPGKARGWYRSLTQSIAELAVARDEPNGEDAEAREARPRSAPAPIEDRPDTSHHVPRSFDVEEAEVWIVDRSGRSSERR
jgi:hypothetical protein